MIRDFYRGKPFPYVTVIVAALCVIVTLPLVFVPEWFDYVAMSTRPHGLWQYLTGIFAHVPSPGGWMALVHMGMNFLALIPFGVIVEKRFGSRRTLLLMLCEWAAACVLFCVVSRGEDAQAAGVSPLCFSVATVGVYLLIGEWKSHRREFWKQFMTYFLLFEILGMLGLLMPRGSMVSCALHLSGVVTGAAAVFLWTRKSRKSARPL